MKDKLNTGDPFPDFPLTLVDGGTLTLPGEPPAGYLVVLLYRGSF